MQVSKELLISLVRLNADPEFRHLLEHFKSELQEADIKNRRLTGEALYRSQGKASFLDEFLERAANARASVDKMRT